MPKLVTPLSQLKAAGRGCFSVDLVSFHPCSLSLIMQQRTFIIIHIGFFFLTNFLSVETFGVANFVVSFKFALTDPYCHGKENSHFVTKFWRLSYKERLSGWEFLRILVCCSCYVYVSVLAFSRLTVFSLYLFMNCCHACFEFTLTDG